MPNEHHQYRFAELFGDALVDAELPAGRHTAVWDACDQSGQGVASGVDVARFQAGSAREMKRMVLIR